MAHYTKGEKVQDEHKAIYTVIQVDNDGFTASRKGETFRFSNDGVDTKNKDRKVTRVITKDENE